MTVIEKLPLKNYHRPVVFTGAGMSAESGIPTYRGKGGTWDTYDWRQYACQNAFDRDPAKVLDFHELRRQKVFECTPHPGYHVITALQASCPATRIITQNIDGMHQRAGAHNVVELHGSLWRLRCPKHGKREDLNPIYTERHCPECGNWLRPDITWFEDALEERVLQSAIDHLSQCDLLLVIGTSAVVEPAASLPEIAKMAGAYRIWINLEPPAHHAGYDSVLQGKASHVLRSLLADML